MERMQELITGIQQVGIGVADAAYAKQRYKELFGMDILIFEDRANAELMQRYTGRSVHSRHAILSMNMAGGGGFEIWQFTSRDPVKPASPATPGDLGIFAARIKTADVAAAYLHFSQQEKIRLSAITIAPDDRPHFWVVDENDNHFDIVEGDEWFSTRKSICGGVTGAVIGVSDMNKALAFYQHYLGISDVIYSGIAPMIDVPPGCKPGARYHRVLLKKPVANQGAFSQLLGSIQIELLQAVDTQPGRIYADRFWGDHGFIHLCFDVMQMDRLKSAGQQRGYPFTVDSANSFPMGSCAGRFCYVEDPDGTLIELVETYRVPVFKKFGWYLDLTRRKATRPLPNWMVGLLSLNRIR